MLVATATGCAPPWYCGEPPSIGDAAAAQAARAWVLRDGEGLPDAFRRELALAVETIAEQEAVPVDRWWGFVQVCRSERALHAWGRSRGEHAVWVVYNEGEGAGPEPGTTAIEHELCHAAMKITAGDPSEEAANRCASEAFATLAPRL